MIRERSVGENDKFIDILTNEYGVIEASVKGVKKITSKFGGAVQMLAYSTFCLDKRGERYYLNSAQPISIFYELRLDVEKLSLAMYFAELVKFAVSSEEPSGNVLRLTLNSLHYLSSGKRENMLIKAVFELRLLTKLGFMPNLSSCASCACFEHDIMCFLPQEGIILCGDCYTQSEIKTYFLSPSVLHAMRYIIYSDLDKLFSFKLTGESLEHLDKISEDYTILQLDRKLKTLDFYHSVRHL